MWLGMSVVDTVMGSPKKEAEGFQAAVREAKARHAHSHLINAVLAAAREPSGVQRRGFSAASPEELLARLRRVAKGLDERVSVGDAREFKEFLIEFGRRVARASSESVAGSRMKVSQLEERFLQQAAVALGLRSER